jgi:dUTP pyrophosphatase
MKLKFQRIRDVDMPRKAYDSSAGIDFFIPRSWNWQIHTIKPGFSALIPSGIVAEIPEGYCLVAFNKSSLGAMGLTVGACVVDSEYRGEIHLNVFNHSTKEITIKEGQKLIQFLLLPVPSVEIEEGEVTSKTERGSGGFGSTNEK